MGIRGAFQSGNSIIKSTYISRMGLFCLYSRYFVYIQDMGIRGAFQSGNSIIKSTYISRMGLFCLYSRYFVYIQDMGIRGAFQSGNSIIKSTYISRMGLFCLYSRGVANMFFFSVVGKMRCRHLEGWGLIRIEFLLILFVDTNKAKKKTNVL